MWDKKFRIAVFLLLYNILFKSISLDDFISKSATQEFKSELFALSDIYIDQDLDKVFTQILLFYELENEFSTKIKASIKSWDKTFEIIKACLFTFCLEIRNISKLDQEKFKIVNTYLRLSQDYLGQENVPLIHAIILKISAMSDSD
jgi:transcription termination factor NusB